MIQRLAALIPLKDGMLLDYEFLNCLNKQLGVSVDVMPLTRPRVDLVEGKDKGWKSKTEAKNIMREEVIKLDYDYILLLNNNVYLKDELVIYNLFKFLEEHKDYGAVGYDVHGRKFRSDCQHINLECCLVRKEVLKKIEFRNSCGDCDCRNFYIDVVEKLKCKLKYL